MTEFFKQRFQSCWVLAGHETGARHQAIGLAQHLEVSYQIVTVALSKPWSYLPGYWVPGPLQKIMPALSPPWPDLIICCGRRQAPIAAAIKRASHGRTFLIYIHHPEMPYHCFDAVVLAGHDKVPQPMPVQAYIQTLPLHHLTAGKLAAEKQAFADVFAGLSGTKVAVILGGKSRAHDFPEDAARAMVKRLIALQEDTDCALLVTTSRRTPLASQAVLKAAFQNRANTYYWDGQSPNPYLGILAWSDHIVVTEDSASMISEACYTGRPVYLYAIPGNHQKFAKLYDYVQQQGYAHWFDGRLVEGNAVRSQAGYGGLIDFIQKRAEPRSWF